MLGILCVISFILFIVFLFVAAINENNGFLCAAYISASVFVLFFGIGMFTGFVNYPPTEGSHVGVVTAVDLEGVYFRRYEVYLKSSGYTAQSDETVYLLYDYEKDLVEELKSYLGKQVKLTYGHDGGYIGWNDCGTYHIKSVDLFEEGE